MAKYYHISTDLTQNGEFTPRIPSVRADNEDTTLPRICVSRTIEGAVSAIPNGGTRLYELISKNNGFLKLFIFDSETLDLNDDNMIDSDTLYEKGLVHDAIITDEYWITKPVTIPESDQQIIIPVTWDEDVYDVIPYHVVKLSETDEYDDDIESAYHDTMKENIPNVIRIVDFKYNPTILEKDATIDIPFGDSNDLDHWKDIIVNLNLPIAVCVNSTDEIQLKIKETVDITKSILEMQLRNES